jgi:hypothetical protein
MALLTITVEAEVLPIPLLRANLTLPAAAAVASSSRQVLIQS